MLFGPSSLDFEKGNLTLVFDGLPQEFCSILIVKKATIETIRKFTYKQASHGGKTKLSEGSRQG